MKRLFTIISALLLICALFAGCIYSPENKSDGTINIVASVYPVYIFAANVTSGVSGVSLRLMDPAQTGCLHDYQLTTGDMLALESADVFIVNGGGMESFLANVTAKLPDLSVLNASDGVDYIADAQGNINPHAWLTVPNAVKYVGNIAAWLESYDTEHADVYARNAQSYIARLTALDTEMHGELDGLAHRDIVTLHEAFPYFADAFGLNIAAVVERDPNSAPSPAELENTIDIIKTVNVTAIFVEPQYSPQAAERISNETGVPVYALNPITGGDTALTAYEDIMRRNAAVLLEALS